MEVEDDFFRTAASWTRSKPISARPAGTVTQAVIMAGGKGTRLHPYSALFPKPLMPLGDMPILEQLFVG